MRVFHELSIYRLVGQTSHFFFLEDKLNFQVYEEFESALEYWIFLALVDKLSRLLQGEDFRAVNELKTNGGPLLKSSGFT